MRMLTTSYPLTHPKMLKDRKEKELSLEDILTLLKYYCGVEWDR